MKIITNHLSGRPESVSEVDADAVASRAIDHEVGEVSVADADEPVAERQHGVARREVRLEHKERLARLAHA